MRSHILFIFVLTLMVSMVGCEAGGGKTQRSADGEVKQPQIIAHRIQNQAMDFKGLIEPRDKILFVGDEITQQMFYTRAFATGLLGYYPDHQLTFYNGGYDEATAEKTIETIDRLLLITRPTVVFICLGKNDGAGFFPVGEQRDGKFARLVKKYEKDLGDLVSRINSTQSVRRVVVLSAPAQPILPDKAGKPRGYNKTLREFALAGQRVAKAQNEGFVDLFEPMHITYQANYHAGGKPMTIGGIPNESAQAVMASVMFWGIGMDEKKMNGVGWAPLAARKMIPIRGVLGMNLKLPTTQQAELSREIYEAMRVPDQRFFRLWRISDFLERQGQRRASIKKPEELKNLLKADWQKVHELTSYYGQD